MGRWLIVTLLLVTPAGAQTEPAETPSLGSRRFRTAEENRAILLDPDRDPEALARAAQYLTLHQNLAEARTLRDPTAAEALLRALDACVASLPELADEELREAARRRAERVVRCFARLADRRVVPALLARLEDVEEPCLRRALTLTIEGLGEPAALDAAAKEVARGTWLLDGPLDETLLPLVEALQARPSPVREDALMALAAHDHAFGPALSELLLDPRASRSWRGRPFAPAILVRDLGSHEPAEGRWELIDSIETRGPGAAHRRPADLVDVVRDRRLDPIDAVREVRPTRAEAAADALSRLVIGLPAFSAFLPSERRAAALRLMAFEGPRLLPRLRRSTRIERLALDDPREWIVDLSPLDRSAKADDVVEGRAVFCLPRSWLTPVRLPALAEALIAEAPETVIVVQAEDDRGLRRRWGVISRRGLSATTAVHDLRPIPDGASLELALRALTAAAMLEDRAALERLVVDRDQGDVAFIQMVVDDLGPPRARERLEEFMRPTADGWRVRSPMHGLHGSMHSGR